MWLWRRLRNVSRVKLERGVRLLLEMELSERLVRLGKLASGARSVTGLPLSPKPVRFGSDFKGVGSAMRLSFKSRCLSRVRVVKKDALLMELSKSQRLVRFRFASGV